MVRRTYPVLTAAEAAAIVNDGALVGFSGFTAAGSPKVVPGAIAERAKAEHKAGRPFRIRLLTGASTGPLCDDLLVEADAISWRAPFQSSAPLRTSINTGRVDFLDMHLSDVPQKLQFGFLGAMDVAVIEATEVTPDGRVYLTTGIGISPTLLRCAKKVIIELNAAQSPRIPEMLDMAVLPSPPERIPIPVMTAMQKIGLPYACVDPAKVIGVVHTDGADNLPSFTAPDETSRRIARHVSDFLIAELRAGRIPEDFLPLQAGVGNVSNAVLAAIGENPAIPQFEMYTEVIQDAQIAMLQSGRLRGASTCAMAVSKGAMEVVFDNMDFFAPRVVLRPVEITNSPGVVRRLGVIGINTVLEFDIYGCANSTHVCGTQLVNGVGGSGDFTRNAYLSILMAPSTAKDGKISTVVPMVTHCDHNEHSVQIFVTDQGLADLRGLGPHNRAKLIIDKCAHPSYRPYLHNYLERSRPGHLRHNLSSCFDLHRSFLESGSMLPAANA
jgi:acetyl-CoA hydrolase